MQNKKGCFANLNKTYAMDNQIELNFTVNYYVLSIIAQQYFIKINPNLSIVC